MPAHFEQAAQLVTDDMTAEKVSCGPDVQAHVESVAQYRDAGYDEVYLAQIGGAGKDFFRFAGEELLLALREGS